MMKAMLKTLSKNWFIAGIFIALVLGFTFADVGARLNTSSRVTTTLVVLLFLISGLKLPSESIRTGMSEVRVHIYIQSFIFIVMPAFFYLAAVPFRSTIGGDLVIGFYALAVLPTTISSCIIFTQMAEGNVVATMFNAAIANMAGIIVSPLLLSLLLRTTGAPLPVDELLNTLRSLVLKMLLPIAVGQIARIYVKKTVTTVKKQLSILSNVFILLILFFTFAKTAQNPEFVESLREMIGPFAYLAGAHIVVLGLAYAGAKALRLSHESTISVMFAGPQKTLAMGVPLLTTYFADRPEILGISLLPLLFYHPWQLFVAGFLPRLLNRKRQRQIG